MKPTLLVLAAGMGTRYGGNKQLDTVGPNGETIIDFSIFDAVRAGFGKILFVIRRDIEKQIVETFIKPLQGIVEVDYVFQEIDNLPGDLKPAPGRTKPWGTSHAILVSREKINEPFGVINADDYYGIDSFRTLHDFLVNDDDDKNYCIVGYKMINTLSDHGHVNRGVCKIDDNEMLLDIVETHKIEKRSNGIFAPSNNDGFNSFTGEEIVSMNLWGFKPSCFGYLQDEFISFINRSKNDPKAELDIPTSMDVFIKRGEISIRILLTDEKWFGVTYREDKPYVIEGIQKLFDNGTYPPKLWNK
ncbi:MAG: nucleotidyltransferase [Bacteroidales bacterium]|nr:nucleotidyltransferase [Bacteroidales bacterium]